MNNKYIIFARTASQQQKLDDYSIDAQVNTLKELARRQKLSVSEVVTEIGVSGISKNRPAFKRIMEMLKNGEIKGFSVRS